MPLSTQGINTKEAGIHQGRGKYQKEVLGPSEYTPGVPNFAQFKTSEF